MYRRSRERGPPQHKKESKVEVATSPLIPLQEEIQPLQEIVQPLIPLQLPSPRAKLQHELSHATATLPNQTGAAPPMATKLSRRRLQKRQAILTTTITDANVVVIDGSGHTITVESLTHVPTGPIAISLPFTTVTIPPLASVTGIIPISIGSPGAQPNPGGVTPSSPPSPVITASSTPTPQTAGPQISNTQVPTASSSSSISIAAPSNSGNNNIGSSSTSSSTTSSLTPASTSSTTTTSSSNTPTSSATTTSSTSATSSSIPIPTASTSISSPSSASSSYTFSSSLTNSSSSSFYPTSTGSSTVIPAAPSSISSTPAATTSAAAAASGGGPSVNAQVAGGVVGGLAGLALLLGLLLVLLRWLRKRRSGSMMLRSIDDEVAPGTSHSNGPMTQLPTSAVAGAGAAAGGAGIGALIKRMTGSDTSDTGPSERGFQNLGGRKLESVLISGGDGYGEPSGPGSQTPSSFSRGWAERFPYDTPSQHSSMIVGPATPYRRPSSSIAELSSSRPDSETLRAMPSSPPRPSPVPAWPLSNTSAGKPVGPSRTSESSDSVLPLPNPRGLDPLGRSRASQDGSRNSRFTEGL